MPKTARSQGSAVFLYALEEIAKSLIWPKQTKSNSMYRAFSTKITRAHLLRNYTVFVQTDMLLVIASFTRF